MERPVRLVGRLFDRSKKWFKRVTSRHQHPEDLPIAAVAPPPEPENTAGEKVQLRFQIYSKSAPRWNDAVGVLKTRHPKDYAALETMADGFDPPDVDPNHRLEWNVPKRIADDPESSEIIQRMKRLLPSLAALRGIVMAAAAIDPFKLAPVICASILFTIDFTLNLMEPHERMKILEALFESSNVINESISFESGFPQKDHPAIKEHVANLEKKMPDLYLQALKILSDIHYTHNEPGVGASFRSRAAKLTGKILVWEEQKAKLKLCRTEWSDDIKIMERKLSADETITKILTWIADKNDPEPTLEDIRLKVNSDDRYRNCARWFFDGDEFQGWSKGFKALESEHEYKQALWMRGDYGTGKTTLMYHAVSTLQSLANSPFRDEVLRVIPYFCAASGIPSKRPSCEIIIRSMCKKLSLMPDFKLAEPADKFYSDATSTRGLYGLAKDEPWKTLLGDLISKSSNLTKHLFIVDGLDECESTEDVETLLEFMSRIMTQYPNVQLMCSSHQHVRVERYFPKDHLKVNITAVATADDIKAFVEGEITYLRGIIKFDSLFFRPDGVDLLDRVKAYLIKYANGMFLWVEIWLKVLLPTHNDQKNVTEEKDAIQLLDALKDSSSNQDDLDAKVKDGYERLWAFNTMRIDTLRSRLFHFILCSKKPLSPATVTQALRVRLDEDDEDNLYNERLEVDYTRRLYSNFLTENATGNLVFTHNAAKKFVSKIKIKDEAGSEIDKFSETRNNLIPAELYIEVLKRADHPLWQHAGMNPSNWRDFASHEMIEQAEEYRNWGKLNWGKLDTDDDLLTYLTTYGLRHCFLAAEKRSLFDRLWTQVLDKLVLSHQSAFPFAGLLVGKLGNPHEEKWDGFLFECLIGANNEGHPELLPSHLLAWLDIVADDDFPLADWNPDQPPTSWNLDADRFRHLFEHAAQDGGSPIRRGTAGMGPVAPLEINALQIACEYSSNATVSLILNATAILSGGPAVLNLLRRHNYGHESPFILAIQRSHIAIVKTLLEAEIRYATSGGGDDGCAGAAPRQPPKSTLWWHIFYDFWETGRTALSLAKRRFDKQTIGELLRLAPVDMDDEPQRLAGLDEDDEGIPSLVDMDDEPQRLAGLDEDDEGIPTLIPGDMSLVEGDK